MKQHEDHVFLLSGCRFPGRLSTSWRSWKLKAFAGSKGIVLGAACYKSTFSDPIHAMSILQESGPLSLRLLWFTASLNIDLITNHQQIYDILFMKEYFIPESVTNPILSVSDDYKRFICPKSAVYLTPSLPRYVCPCFLLAGENSPELAEIKRINRELQVSRQEQWGHNQHLVTQKWDSLVVISLGCLTFTAQNGICACYSVLTLNLNLRTWLCDIITSLEPIMIQYATCIDMIWKLETFQCRLKWKYLHFHSFWIFSVSTCGLSFRLKRKDWCTEAATMTERTLLWLCSPFSRTPSSLWMLYALRVPPNLHCALCIYLALFTNTDV